MLAVTGITGHTGRFFALELAKAGYSEKIRCLIRTPGRAGFLGGCGLDAELLAGSLESEESLRALMRGADTVVHIAGIHHSPAILRIGRECGVKRFILVHTTGIYSRFKAASRDYIRVEQEIAPWMEHVTILRPTMIFGDLCDHNISKFIRFVDRLPVLPAVAGGRALIQPVNARDLARGIRLALQTPESAGKAYDLSGQQAVSLRQLYGMIAADLGKRRPVIGIPMWMCVAGAWGLKLCSLGRVDLVEKVQRMGEDRSYSHAAAAAELGYAPEPFAVGLKREVDAYLARK